MKAYIDLSYNEKRWVVIIIPAVENEPSFTKEAA